MPTVSELKHKLFRSCTSKNQIHRILSLSTVFDFSCTICELYLQNYAVSAIFENLLQEVCCLQCKIDGLVIKHRSIWMGDSPPVFESMKTNDVTLSLRIIYSLLHVSSQCLAACADVIQQISIWSITSCLQQAILPRIDKRHLHYIEFVPCFGILLSFV